MEFSQKFISIYFILLYLPCVILKNTNSEEIVYSLLDKELFEGEWKSNNPSYMQFNYLTLDSGFIQVRIEKGRLYFIALNPRYAEDKFVSGSFELTNYSEITQSWTGSSKLYLEGGYQNTNLWYDSFGIATYDVKLNQQIDNLDINQLQIDVDLISGSGMTYHGFANMSFSVKRIYDYSFINCLIFCIIATIILVAQYLAASKILKQLKQQQILFEQQSRLCSLLSMLNGLSTFYLFVDLLFQNFNYFYFFIVPTVILFASLFKDSYIFNILFYRIYQNRDQRRGPKLARFIGLLVLIQLIVLANYAIFRLFGYTFQVMLFQAFILYPLIIHNLRLGILYQFNKLQIFGCLSPRLFFYIYIRSCPANVKDAKPNYVFVGVFLAVYLFSILILLLQTKYRTRCFNAKVEQPKVFSYLQRVKINDSIECPICMGALHSKPSDMDGEPLGQQLICDIMVTPCQHMYHQECLENWMQVQKNCPVCRGALNLENNIEP